MRRPISSYSPIFYFMIVKLRRFARRLKWWFGDQKFAKTLSTNLLEHSVFSHRIISFRRSDTAVGLQDNKAVNLKIALLKLNGVIIHPGETFSLCRLLGCATKRKGYKEARTLQNGKVAVLVGGGLCKMVALIDWICLHSPLTVVECHQHSFDHSPDEEGEVPSGTGPTYFYNYLDYQIKNDTPYTFQVLLHLDGDYLNGELRVDTAMPHKYQAFEANDHFVKTEDNIYRKIEIWQHKYAENETAAETNVETKLIRKTKVLIKYDVTL